jgi:hypothetical protein
MNRDGLVSPWLLVTVAAWLVLVAIGTTVAIPAFANVAVPGLQCDPACPTVTTVEWIPGVLSAALAATAVIGLGFAGIWAIRRRRHPAQRR